MDGTSLGIIIPGALAAFSAVVTLYMVIVKGNTKIKIDDATIIRSNLIPTSEWLRREGELNTRLDKMEERIDKQREDYEKRLVEKDTMISRLTEQVRVLTERTDEQDKTIDELQKQVNHA